jgi:phosphotransferase family enzyme
LDGSAEAARRATFAHADWVGWRVTQGTSPALRRSPKPAQLAWVERTVGAGARVTGGRRMLGGITSSVHRLSLRLPGGTSMQVVLKRFTDPDWGDVQSIVLSEAAALAAVEATSVPAPRLIGASPDGAETEGVPSLLMTRAPGRIWLTPPDLDAWIRQLATLLPSVHSVAANALTDQPPDLDDPGGLTAPTSARRPGVWTAAKRVIATEQPPAGAVLVHGDYQHFNVLWSRGRLSALVDWGSSRIAHPDVDVGHCRLNLAVLFSAEAAERFRHVYESEAGRRVEPWWDIHQLLAYDDSWQDFIPVQVADRAPVDVRGMTWRVEELLAMALARM